MHKLRVGFIGLGDQGLPMAEAIAAAGHELHVWARRPASTEPVKGIATVHPSLPDLGTSVEHLGICVGNEDDVQAVLFESGLAEAARPGTVVAIHSTISPEGMHRLAASAAEHQIALIDAPVSGGNTAARERRLLVLVGGDQATFERALPVLSTYGRFVRLLGVLGAGQRAKILNNLLMFTNLASAHLVLELGCSLGIERGELRELFRHGSASSFALDILDTAVIPGAFDTRTSMKDLALGREIVELADGDRTNLDRLNQLVELTRQVNRSFAPDADLPNVPTQPAPAPTPAPNALE